MTAPNKTSVLERLDECRRIGEQEFLNQYASGRAPRAHYLIHEGKRYPLKAVWAASHQPPIHTRDFKTGVAQRGLKRLGFDIL
jgi:hypothetical protein